MVVAVAVIALRIYEQCPILWRGLRQSWACKSWEMQEWDGMYADFVLEVYSYTKTLEGHRHRQIISKHRRWCRTNSHVYGSKRLWFERNNRGGISYLILNEIRNFAPSPTFTTLSPSLSFTLLFFMLTGSSWREFVKWVHYIIEEHQYYWL